MLEIHLASSPVYYGPVAPRLSLSLFPSSFFYFFVFFSSGLSLSRALCVYHTPKNRRKRSCSVICNCQGPDTLPFLRVPPCLPPPLPTPLKKSSLSLSLTLCFFLCLCHMDYCVPFYTLQFNLFFLFSFFL